MEGRFNGGFFALPDWGLIFGGLIHGRGRADDEVDICRPRDGMNDVRVFSPRGLLLGILDGGGGGVLPGFPNPDPISDQKLSFPHLFSDLACKIYIRFQTCNTSVMAHKTVLYMYT